MKTQRTTHWLLLAATLMLLAGGAATVKAVGTLAGTSITNQAYADYKDANANALPRVYSNTVTTVVSQVAGVDVVPPTASATGTNGTDVSYLVEFFNTGNGPDVYDFSYIRDGGTWDPANVKFYYDADNSHTLSAAEIAAGPLSTLVTGTVQPDDDWDVFMVVSIPTVIAGTAPDGSQNVTKVTAVSRFNNAVTDFGTYTTQVSSAVITAVKTSNPHLPDTPVPGQVVTYSITLTNSGTNNSTGVVLTDPIPAGLTYVPGSIKLNTVGKTDTNDLDGADFNLTNPGKVTVSVGTIASGGGTATIDFQVTVNANEPSGTPLTNQATVTYKNNNEGPDITITTNGHTFFVGTTATVSASPDRTGTANPGDTKTYPFTVTNHGNAPDVFEITTVSSTGLTWAVWVDANNDGIAGNDGDYLLTDSNNDGKIDTGSLNQYGILNLLAVATIAPGTADNTTDVTTLTFTSTNDPTKSDPEVLTTTVTAPVLSVTKTVAPTGNQPPGTVLTYTMTVTNSGSGNATSVVISDLIPQYTAYNPGTIKTGSTLLNLAARTDANDNDGAQHDAGSNAILSDPTVLGPGGVRILQFQVTIQ